MAGRGRDWTHSLVLIGECLFLRRPFPASHLLSSKQSFVQNRQRLGLCAGATTHTSGPHTPQQGPHSERLQGCRGTPRTGAEARLPESQGCEQWGRSCPGGGGGGHWACGAAHEELRGTGVFIQPKGRQAAAWGQGTGRRAWAARQQMIQPETYLAWTIPVLTSGDGGSLSTSQAFRSRWDRLPYKIRKSQNKQKRMTMNLQMVVEGVGGEGVGANLGSTGKGILKELVRPPYWRRQARS